MNAEKTESMIFLAKKDKPFHPSLYLSNVLIKEVFQHEHLGVTLTFNLSWRSHILKIHQKASKRLNMLKPMRLTLTRKTLDTLYKSLVRSCLEYADIVWDGCIAKLIMIFLNNSSMKQLDWLRVLSQLCYKGNIS
jgi:hypothetical protein